MGRDRGRGDAWGPYEHTQPLTWKPGQNTSEAYRRTASIGWVAQDLALRLMHAEKSWNHDAFFDYVDRWMSEDDAAFVKTIKDATGKDHDHDWSRQGQAWDAFVNEMWAKHRPVLAAPLTDGSDNTMTATTAPPLRSRNSRRSKSPSNSSNVPSNDHSHFFTLDLPRFRDFTGS